MKRNPITLITGGLLLILFALMLFVFQVRTTEVAVVTTFGRFSRSITNADWYARLPWPIQKVTRFDKRIQSFETKLDQTTTKDSFNIVISVYVGWRVADPQVFLQRFNGSTDYARAEVDLEAPVRNVKTLVIGQHPFSALVSTKEAEIQFDQIEKEMLTGAQAATEKQFGIKIEILNIKQIGLPESVTSKVFDRMTAERRVLAQRYRSQGEATASIIRANANSEASRLLNVAAAEAKSIQGDGEREAAASYKEFALDPEFAVYLLSLKTLEETLKERATLILDPQTPPFNLLSGQGNITPMAPKKTTP